MNDAIFDNCSFIDCVWAPVSVENAVFRSTYLCNVKFKSMNFEFSTFENISTKDIKLPFPTIPFIYNGLTYVSTTNDNIRVTSDIKKAGLTAQEYLENLNDLERFYILTQNYFPLANIYISQKKYDQAYETILCGIHLSIALRSFRMISYFCKQLDYIPIIGIHQRQEIYSLILNDLSKISLQRFEKDSLNMYLPQVRELLLTMHSSQRIQVILKTNITSSSPEKLSIFITTLDAFLSKKCKYSVELRHNSPYEVFLDIFTSPEKISLIIDGLALMVGIVQLISDRKGKKSRQDVERECKTYNTVFVNNQIVIERIIINEGGNIYSNNSHDSLDSQE